jgi:ubiquinone/menaquinone biosynthesis C-methylase UbiE
MNNRKFYWVSSIDEKNKQTLTDLNSKLSSFYSELDSRQKYNKMIQGVENDQPLDAVSISFLDWFKNEDFKDILEIGCGTGRIRKHLSIKENGNYTGTEVSEDVINKNRAMWPESQWANKSVYNLDFPAESFDLIFSFYVIEHLVFPHMALEKMYSLIKSGGSIVIACPDFVESKRFPSQYIGQSFSRTAKEKVKEFKLIDATVSLYDSRIRLTNALTRIKKGAGAFMININPICLYLPKPINIWPDFDAVYMANKIEIEHWANSKKLKVSYPAGKEGIFKEHVFMVLQK